jgi:hypothetical protein
MPEIAIASQSRLQPQGFHTHLIQMAVSTTFEVPKKPRLPRPP